MKFRQDNTEKRPNSINLTLIACDVIKVYDPSNYKEVF